MDAGSNGVTGPCNTSRVVNRCQETADPPTVIACKSIRCLAPITSAGPMVAALGGTAHKSPLAPKLPCIEFCAMVNGLRVQTRGPICFQAFKLAAANSGASGSMNAKCPVHPGPL